MSQDRQTTGAIFPRTFELVATRHRLARGRFVQSNHYEPLRLTQPRTRRRIQVPIPWATSWRPPRGQWQPPVPESVKVAPGSGRNCQSYDLGCSVILRMPNVSPFRTSLLALILGKL
jgi:hypothetical protein